MIATNRTRRAALRDRTRTHRANARITRRGTASLATHVMATGLGPKAARTVASSLRKAATKLELTGRTVRVHAGRKMRTATRWTRTQVAAMATLYRPRRAEYKMAANRLALAA
ncbi:hypothetical protein [Streptomyces sp. NPDC047097]|uniref:hypothetical protein n=1 Tax=Streptomyces sp. NPDC047097 TaxID=3155260 RepID=UPI0033DF3B2E